MISRHKSDEASIAVITARSTHLVTVAHGSSEVKTKETVMLRRRGVLQENLVLSTALIM